MVSVLVNKLYYTAGEKNKILLNPSEPASLPTCEAASARRVLVMLLKYKVCCAKCLNISICVHNYSKLNREYYMFYLS